MVTTKVKELIDANILDLVNTSSTNIHRPCPLTDLKPQGAFQLSEPSTFIHETSPLANITSLKTELTN